MTDRLRRWQRLREFIRRGHVHSQEQLAAMLRKEGVEVTQATLSRDLRELGVMKGAGGYVLPETVPADDDARLSRRVPPGTGGAPALASVATPGVMVELAAALRSYLLGADAGGNLVVLRTGPGQASLLAYELDRLTLRSVLGTVAGDDTIFLAARTPRAAAALLTQLRSLAGLK